MPRAPFQVLVLPFRRRASELEYALFRRADLGYWQGIAGGGEDDEQPLAAARREAWEEARIPLAATYVPLVTSSSVPVLDIHVSARGHWPRNLYVIPIHAFAVDCGAVEMELSAEHTAYSWLPYAEAVRLVRWDSDRTALWELDQRLQQDDLSLAGSEAT